MRNPMNPLFQNFTPRPPRHLHNLPQILLLHIKIILPPRLTQNLIRFQRFNHIVRRNTSSFTNVINAQTLRRILQNPSNYFMCPIINVSLVSQITQWLLRRARPLLNLTQRIAKINQKLAVPFSLPRGKHHYAREVILRIFFFF